MSYKKQYLIPTDKKTGKWSNITTNVLCDIMTDNSVGSELERFIKVKISINASYLICNT